jgi:hypothetical protein
MAQSRRIASMRRAREYIRAYTVLPATRTLNPTGEDLSPITTQSSTEVLTAY